MSPRVERLLKKLYDSEGDYFQYEAHGKAAAEEAKGLSVKEQIELVMETAEILSDRSAAAPHFLLVKPFSALLRKQLPFTSEQILHLVNLGANPPYYFPFTTILRLAESIPLTQELEQALRQMQNATVLQNGQVEGHQGILTRIGELLRGKDTSRAFEPAGS